MNIIDKNNNIVLLDSRDSNYIQSLIDITKVSGLDLQKLDK
jgi:hypothetical protein